MATYKELTKKYVDDERYGISFIVRTYMEHQKKHGEPKATDPGFFDDHGRFQTFLNMEGDPDVIDNTIRKCGIIEAENDTAYRMINEGERLIKEAYKILDKNSYTAHHDNLNENKRTHIVSLIDVHDTVKKDI